MNIEKLLDLRISQRYFDDSQKINADDLNKILQAGKKAPNGFGLEGWKFINITGERTKLQQLAWGQPAISESSNVIALVGYSNDYIAANPEVIAMRLDQMGISQEAKDRYSDLIFNKMDMDRYFENQNHIAAGYMTLQAKDLGIDSLIVGGFDPKAVGELLGLDKQMLNVSLLLCLGYPKKEEQKTRLHRDDKDVIEHVVID